MSYHVGVGQGHSRVGVPAREPARRESQSVPVVNRAAGRQFSRTGYWFRNATYTIPIYKSSPVTVKVSNIAMMIVGIAFTILGVYSLPFDPVGGTFFAGLGVLLTLAGGVASYSLLRERSDAGDGTKCCF